MNIKITLIPIIVLLFLTTQLHAQSTDASWVAQRKPLLSFIENKGQFKQQGLNPMLQAIEFGYDGSNQDYFFTKSGLVIELSTREKRIKSEDEKKWRAEKKKQGFSSAEDFKAFENLGHRLQIEEDELSIKFLGANPNVQIISEEKESSYYSYTFYNENNELVNINQIPAWKKITYKNIYPNIDIEYVIHPSSGFKYSVIVHPGGDISKVRLQYSKNIQLNADGTISTPTRFGNIIDHSPLTFYANNKSQIIASNYLVQNNIISFQLGQYDPNQTIIIDPWTQTPNFVSTGWDCVWECERDGAGNVYVIGGTSPMQLIKYDPAGAIQWTYNTPYDTTSWLGTFAVDNAGNSYVSNGSSAAIFKVNTAGALQWNNASPGGLLALTEFWTITFNCDQTKLLIGGTDGGIFGPPEPYLFDMNMNTGNVLTSRKMHGSSLFDAQEVRAITPCNNGKYYFLSHDSIGWIHQNLTSCTSGGANVFHVNNGINLGYKCENWRYNNTGVSALAHYNGFVYVHRGNQLQKRVFATAAIVGTVAIPGGSFSGGQVGCSGIDIDDCGNIFVGSTNGVYKFDQSLVQTGSFATVFNVYDVEVNSNGEVIAGGSTGNSSSGARTGYIQSFAAAACTPQAIVCCDATVCPAGPLCTTDPTYPMVVTTPGGTFSASCGACINSVTGVFNPAVAGVGTHTITYTLACGSETTTIVVNSCTALAVCQELNGTLTVTGGTGPYTWSQWNAGGTTPITTQAQCLACNASYTWVGFPLNQCLNGAFPVANCTVPAGYVTFATGSNVSLPGGVTYPVRVVDNAGTIFTIAGAGVVPMCSGCATLTVTISSQTNVACNGASTGSFSASTTGGTGPYDYVLLNGATTVATFNNIAGAQAFSGLAAGTYTLNVTDNNNCPGSTTITITQPSAISITVDNVTNASCGASNGSISVTVAGGAGGYTYLWSNTRTTQDITGLSAGTYTLTTTDASGCTLASSSITVTNASAPTITINSTQNVTCNGGSNGSVDISVAGGTPGYTYLWSNSATTQDLTGLAAGVVRVTVTDAASCTSTSANITITQPSAISVTLNNSTNATCGLNNGSIDMNVAGGTGAFTYLWSNGRTTQDLTGLAGGNYILTVTDANSCTMSSNTITIGSSSAVSVTVNSTQNVTCNGGSNGSVDITPSGGTPGYTYLWSNSATTQDLTGLAASVVRVTVTDAAGCTATSANITITQPSAITVTLDNTTNAACGVNNGSISISVAGGAGGYTYLWSNARTTQDITGLGAGGYNVTVTDASGCSISSPIFNVNSASGLNITIDSVHHISCGSSGADGFVQITVAGGTPGYTYLWSNSQTTQDITGLNAGIVGVTVTDATGCSITSGNITILQQGNVSIVLDNAVNPGCATNNGSISISVSGGSGNYGYNWSNGRTTQDITGLGAGTYIVTITDTVSSGGSGGQVNLYAQAFDGAHGWTLNIPTGVNGADNNYWEVDSDEAGNPVGACGSAGGPNQSLHITSVFNSSGGAAYDAGGLCGILFCPETNMRAESPIFSTVGQSNLTLEFNYIANGDGLIDNASVVYSANGGATWQPLTASIKSPICGGGQGRWTAYTAVLPASCNNNPNVRVGFNWTNNDDGVGTDPSVAIDSVLVFTTTSGSSSQICVAYDTFTLTNPAALAVVVDSSDNLTCNGSANGAAYISVSGGTPNYTYSWSNARTTQDITGLAAGIVNVTVTDAAGCSVSSSNITITQPSAITITLDNTTDAGCGTNNGTISITVAGGTGGYTYLWSNALTTQDITGLGAGGYTVTVTDANGCTAVSNLINVNNASGLNLTIDSVHQVSCNGGNDGFINITASGGTPGYTYNWSNGRTTGDISGLAIGNYQLTVTDAAGCSITSGVINITQPTAITITVDNTTSISCGVANGSVSITVSGGTTTYNYLWSNASTNEDLTGLAIAGTYTITVTDANSCTATASATVTQASAITANISSSTSVTCNSGNNGTATALGAGGTGGYTYNWSCGAQTTQTATGLSAGICVVTVSDANGCAATASVTITEPTALTATVSSSTSVTCNGGNNGTATALGAGGAGGYGYVWSCGAQTTQTATGLSAGACVVTITDANGCTATAAVVITQPTAVGVTATVSSNYNGEQISCNNACDGILTANGGGGTGTINYQWNVGQNTAVATGICDGSYTVVATDANGCTASANITITEPTAVSATTVGVIPTCNGFSNGTATASGGGGVGGYSFQWAANANNQTTPTATGLAAGTYSVTASDLNGCTATSSVTIGQPTPVIATVSSTAVSCNGGSDGTGVIVNVSGGTPGTPNYTFNWGNGPTAATSSPGFPAGTYTVTISDGNGCTITRNYTITEPSAMSFTVSNTNVSCFGGTNGTATINVSGGVGGFTYNWNGGQNTATATGLVAGTHCVTATDGNGCTVSTCITVTEPSALSLSFSNIVNVSCFGGNNGRATVTATGGTQPYFYSWSNGENTPTASALNANNHGVTITDANGCTIVGNVTITQPTALQLSFTMDTVNCRGGNDGRLTANVSGGTFPYTYLWNAATGNQVTATATGLVAGNYTVTATDFNGCRIIGSSPMLQPSAPLTASIISTTNPSCNNSCDGIIEVDAQGATPNYTFQWSNGQNTSIATGVCAGVHRVTITDANGCSTTASGILTQPSAIILNPSILSNYNGSPITCPGAADGSVGVVAAGGNGGFSYIWSPNGQNTANINGLVEGTYCVTVTDVRGCKADTCITINDPTPLQANFTQVNILCHGDANGQILVNAVTGTGTIGINGYEYKLTGPGQVGNVYSNVNAYSNLVAGAYTIFVRDGNDCEIQIPVQITEPAEVVVTAVNVTNALCYGSATGTATAVVTGGTGAYTYIWSNSQTTNPATGLALGLYTVTVADANGCNKVETFNVGQAPELIGSVTATPVACLGGVSTATATASGGTPINLNSYLYRWTNGTTNATAVNLSAGVHCVTITDANACTIVECVTITEPATAVSATISSQTAALCQGTATGTATAQGVGGTAPYTYVWQTLPNQSTQTATGLQTGIYAVVVTDDNGCTSQTNVTITEPNSVSVSIVGIGGATCNGLANGTATAVGAGGVGGFTYNWNNGETTATATGLAAGNNTVTITDANGCSTTAIAVITQPTAVEITNLSTTDVACFGDATGTAALSVQGGTPTNGYIYNWSSGVSQNGVTVSGLSAGSHTVTVTDANGCYDIDTFVINQPATGLTGYLTGTPALCFGTSSGQMGAVVQGGTPYPNGSYVYEWNTNPAQSTVVADSIPAGTYTVTVTDFNTCSIVLTGTIGQAPQLNITATIQQPVTCNGGNNGIAIATTATGGTPGYTYVWTDAAGQVGQVATGLSAGVVSVVVTDANGCSASAAVTVTEGAPIALNANITNVSCYGGNNGGINITNPNITIVGYAWSNGMVGNLINNLTAGAYTVTVTANNGCKEEFTYTVTEPATMGLELAQTNEILCYGDNDGEIQASLTGGTPNYSYAWSNGMSGATISNLGPGAYAVTVTDANGCRTNASITITQPAMLTVVGVPTGTLCAGDNTGRIAAYGTGGTLTTGFLQYSIDGQNWSGGNLFAGLTAGIYNLQVQDQNGCIADTAVVIQDADPFFITSLTADTTIEYLDTMQVFAMVNDTTGVDFTWYDISNGGGLITNSSYDFTIAPEEPITYQFTATNANGCEVDSIVIIEVEKPRRANAPLAFTPNGDGANDYFFIQGDDKVGTVTLFRIYDRWGELVFEGQNLDVNVAEQGWNGVYKGQPSTSGNYTWYADVLFKDGETIQIKGDVTLLR